MNNLLSQFVSAIDAEITLIEKESRNQAYELLSGQREEKSTGTLYIFVLADPSNLPEEATGTLKVDGRDINALVVSQEGNRLWLLLESLEPLPEYIASARLVINETDLLKRLKEKIETLKSSSNYGLTPKVFGLDSSVTGSTALPVKLGDRLTTQGMKVLQQSIGSEVTFVWGPPGTGKTLTIAALVTCLAESSETVLVTSHTHAAIEQALWALIEPSSTDRRPGFMFENPLVAQGKILKIGQLKSSKIPRSVHLDSYLEDKAKEREENIQILDEERGRLVQQSEKLKAALVPWSELRQADLGCDKSRQAYESAVAKRNDSALRMTNAKETVVRCEAEQTKAEHSFLLGRSGRIRRAQTALMSARKVLNLAQAEAGQDEANALRSERDLSEAQARLLLLREATRDLRPLEELENELAMADDRVKALGAEMEAIRTVANDDAKRLVENAAAIFATLTKLYVDRKLLPDMKWDTVIVDEVSMAMPPLLAYAASRAKKRVVLVGDMYQLPPVVNSSADSAGAILGKDIFELRGITKFIDSGMDVPELAKLNSQHRMHPDIASGAKVLIESYKHLENSTEVLTRRRPDFLSAIGVDSALAVIDISRFNPWSGKMPGSLSRFNFISGQVSVELAALYAARLDEPDRKNAPPIGIVTPYAAQRRFLSKLIQIFGLDRWVAAGTVHTFQGSECEVIIFDSVLGEPHWTSRFTNPSDLREVRRDLNVALTRARHQFIFVGDSRWLKQHAKVGTGYGNLWTFLEKHAAQLQAIDFLGERFQERVAKTVSQVKAWDINGIHKVTLLTETEFYGFFTADLMGATRRVVLYTPFIGKTRWPQVAPYIALLRERGVDVFLLHKPLTDPEWRRSDNAFGKGVLDSLTRLGVKLIPMSGVHAKTIVIDSEVVYEGSLNWASQTSSYEHMWRFKSSDMARLVEKMLQLEPITNSLKEESGARCPYCGGPLVLINQAGQNPRDPYPLKLGCARWNADKNACSGYLRRVDGRVPFLQPPRCSLGANMQLVYSQNGRPWAWKCGHKGCRPIRWVKGDYVE